MTVKIGENLLIGFFVLEISKIGAIIKPGFLKGTWNRADIISKFGFGKRLRKPRTAAGFVPKACKTQANKTLETSPTEPTKKKEKEGTLVWNIARYARLESRRHHLEIWLWKTVAKASNSSRIRAQGMQNTSQQNSRNVPYGTHEKEKERKKIASRPSDIARNNSTIARYARLESRRHHLEIWLWKTVAKASNSSRIRAQGMQNTSQ